jgi:hypothetical protein
MRCPRCNFENMPGLRACARCYTVLDAAEAVQVEPPRAGRLTRPFRPMRYWLNRLLGRTVGAPAEAVLARVPRLDGFLLALLSVIPGLGHVWQGRFLNALPRVLAWVGLAIAGLVFYGTPAAAAVLAAAVLLHALIALDASGWGVGPLGVANRLALIVALSLPLAFLYVAGVGGLIGQHVIGARAPYPVVAARIREGDYLLVLRRAYAVEPPRRGDLVLCDIPEIRFRAGTAGVGDVPVIVREGQMLATVVGLPGETVDLGPRLMVSSGGQPVAAYAAPIWPQGVRSRVMLREGEWCCLPHGLFTGRNYPRTEVMTAVLGRVSVRSGTEIVGRVFMLYNPITRRRFIPREPAAPVDTQAQP